MTLDQKRPRAVVGAGLMGHGIAQVLAMRPGDVWLYDVNSSALDRATERIREGLAMLVRHGLLDETARRDALTRIRTTTDLAEAVGSAWFAIEAAPEDLALKQVLFAQLEKLAPHDAILATNTSSLTISQISANIETGERMVGSHFFLPAQVLPLVEVSRGPSTRDETMSRTISLWRECGKVPIRVEQDIPGYVANRLQAAINREALSLLARGVASPADIDTAVRTGFGLRYLVSGPLEQRDFAGLDLSVKTARGLWPDLDQATEPHQHLLDKVDRGELGIKTGRGFYDWTAGNDPDELRRDQNEALLSAMATLGLWPSPSGEPRPED